MLHRLLVVVAILLTTTAPSFGQIPAVSSRPGAAYTLYLDFGGFDFVGDWGGTSSASGKPGVTPAYTGTTANMTEIWTRTAEKYSAFDVNVTTVDPSIGSALSRQLYYDSNAQMMHTVIGGNGSWSGGGGVSFVGTTAGNFSGFASQNSGNGAGFHTNWVFSSALAGNVKWISEAAAHENGHGLNLDHQSLYTGTSLTQEYDPGSGTGVGSVAPIMGDSYDAQRGTWRVGQSAVSSTTIQNDVKTLLGNANLTTFLDSGKGHTRATATALPLTGTTIDFNTAKGIITPVSTADPNPIGEANYTTDFFSFVIASGQTANLSVVLRSGRSTITAGVADPGATLNATLYLLDASGTIIATSNSGIFTESITMNGMTTGTYYLQIASAGGTTFGTGTYFDMGSYFLTGSLSPVPEPATVLTVAVIGLASWRVRRSVIGAIAA